MLKQINVCDRCGGECKWDSIYAVVGLPGVRPTQEDVREPVDLCCACMRWMLGQLVSEMTCEQAAAWVKLARTPQKPIRM